MADGTTSSIVRMVGDLGERLCTFTQRWIPDSWVVCMILTVMAVLLAMLGASQVSAATAQWLAVNNRVWVITGEASVLQPQLEAAGRIPDRIIVASVLAQSP